MVNQKLVHRIVSTSFGEVMLYGGFDYARQEPFCDMYIGDNFDDFIGSIDCSIYDTDENIEKQVENALGYE